MASPKDGGPRSFNKHFELMLLFGLVNPENCEWALFPFSEFLSFLPQLQPALNYMASNRNEIFIGLIRVKLIFDV